MKIDMQVEPRVREVLDACVKRDERRFKAALGALDEAGAVEQGVLLASAIVGVVLSDMFNGKPTADEVRGVAAAVSELEQWQRPEQGEIEKYLTAVTSDATPSLEPHQVVVLSFLVAASLLAGRSKAEDGSRWFDYLDRVEAVIERA